MPNRVYKDPAVNLVLERSYDCISRTKISLDASCTVISASKDAIASSRTLLIKISARSIGDEAQLPKKNPLLAMDDESITEMVDNFIAAYLEARDTGDEAGADVIRNALEVTGRYLATKLGPKAAGVPMN